jgi:Transposase DDE domain
MAARLGTPEGRAVYNKRAATIEPVFAQLAGRLGRALNYRGDLADTELHLWAASHNLLKASPRAPPARPGKPAPPGPRPSRPPPDRNPRPPPGQPVAKHGASMPAHPLISPNTPKNGPRSTPVPATQRPATTF